jgi:xylonate dehydratase
MAPFPTQSKLSPDSDLPEDTRLCAALEAVGGGTRGGCVYDTEAIISRLRNGPGPKT